MIIKTSGVSFFHRNTGFERIFVYDAIMYMYATLKCPYNIEMLKKNISAQMYFAQYLCQNFKPVLTEQNIFTIMEIKLSKVH